MAVARVIRGEMPAARTMQLMRLGLSSNVPTITWDCRSSLYKMQFVTELLAYTIPSSATIDPVSESLKCILNLCQSFSLIFLEKVFLRGMKTEVSQNHWPLNLPILDSIIPRYSIALPSKQSQLLTSKTSRRSLDFKNATLSISAIFSPLILNKISTFLMDQVGFSFKSGYWVSMRRSALCGKYMQSHVILFI